MQSRQRLMVLVFVLLCIFLFSRRKSHNDAIANAAAANEEVSNWGGAKPDAGDVLLKPTPPVIETGDGNEAKPKAKGNVKSLQDEFLEEYNLLGKTSKSKLYGGTLNNLNLKALDRDTIRHPEYVIDTNITLDYTTHKPVIYKPYLDPAGWAWKIRSKNNATAVECDGPWNGSAVSQDILAFLGNPDGFPQPGIGSYGILDVDKDLCFEREGRLGPYATNKIEWANVNWGYLQEYCVTRNEERFDMTSKGKELSMGSSQLKSLLDQKLVSRNLEARAPKPVLLENVKRTAVLLRTHSERVYTENDKQNIRSLINELSLRTGGEYQVFILVELRNSTLKIWEDKGAYTTAVAAAVPAEFTNMTSLWNNAVMKSWYPKIPENINNAEHSHWLSVQRFSHLRPEFDFFWDWDMDTRYTGHLLPLLTGIHSFAHKQPRRGLWERGERFFIPDLQGPFDTTFRRDIESKEDESKDVWGAPSFEDIKPVGPKKPLAGEKGDSGFRWGEEEDADYISLAPLFNPKDTAWASRDDVWGYKAGKKLPRRATLIKNSRCSKKLLDAMHTENINGHHTSSGMVPATVALLHSLKAVYAPHPVFFDRDWPAASLGKYFNPGPKGQSGSAGESAFGWGREGRFDGSTWHHRADPPARLLKQWMGFEADGIGGKEWEKVHGRVCLPPMFLYSSVKNSNNTWPGDEHVKAPTLSKAS